MLAFMILLAQGCQEDYEMIDPPMMTDYDDDLDEEVIMKVRWMAVLGNRHWMRLASVSC